MLKRTANIRTGAINFKTRPQFCFALLIVMGLDTAKYLTKEDICQGHQKYIIAHIRKIANLPLQSNDDCGVDGRYHCNVLEVPLY